MELKTVKIWSLVTSEKI